MFRDILVTSDEEAQRLLAAFKSIPNMQGRLKIVELDAAQLPRALGDLDIAAINGNYAETAGLVPARDAIALEGAKGPYANILVVREQDKDQPWVAKIVKAFHSDEVKKFVQATFKNSIVTAW